MTAIRGRYELPSCTCVSSSRRHRGVLAAVSRASSPAPACRAGVGRRSPAKPRAGQKRGPVFKNTSGPRPPLRHGFTPEATNMPPSGLRLRATGAGSAWASPASSRPPSRDYTRGQGPGRRQVILRWRRFGGVYIRRTTTAPAAANSSTSRSRPALPSVGMERSGVSLPKTRIIQLPGW